MGEEGGAVHEIEEPRRETPAVVPVEGTGREGGEGDDGKNDEQAHRPHARTEDELGQCIEGVQERGAVVGEVHVERPSAQQLARAHEGGGFVEVEEGDAKEENAGDQGHGDEQAEDHRPAPGEPVEGHSGAPRAGS